MPVGLRHHVYSNLLHQPQETITGSTDLMGNLDVYREGGGVTKSRSKKTELVIYLSIYFVFCLLVY